MTGGATDRKQLLDEGIQSAPTSEGEKLLLVRRLHSTVGRGTRVSHSSLALSLRVYPSFRTPSHDCVERVSMRTSLLPVCRQSTTHQVCKCHTMLSGRTENCFIDGGRYFDSDLGVSALQILHTATDEGLGRSARRCSTLRRSFSSTVNLSQACRRSWVAPSNFAQQLGPGVSRWSSMIANAGLLFCRSLSLK